MEEPFSFPKWEHDEEDRPVNIIQTMAVLGVVAVCIWVSVIVFVYQVASAVFP
jgi:hypothetical protein